MDVRLILIAKRLQHIMSENEILRLDLDDSLSSGYSVTSHKHRNGF